MTAKKDVQYVAGGATQNSIRAAQWLLQVPGATAYFGSVGKDEYAEKLRDAATAGGVHVRDLHPSPCPFLRYSPLSLARRMKTLLELEVYT